MHAAVNNLSCDERLELGLDAEDFTRLMFMCRESTYAGTVSGG